MEIRKQLHGDDRIDRIEIARGLIQEENVGLVSYRTCNGNALLFST